LKCKFLDLFQQVILESGTVLTCYEDSLGPTNVSMVYAEWACGYTQEMWNSGNFTKLKECLMNISIEDGMKSEGVKLIRPWPYSGDPDQYPYPFTSKNCVLESHRSYQQPCLLEHGPRQLFLP
jgi:hypothetical protein